MGRLLKRYLKEIKPASLAVVLFTYLLGTACAKYLGSKLETTVLFLGLIIIEILFIGMGFSGNSIRVRCVLGVEEH